jgi:signal transduction histidine kinase
MRAEPSAAADEDLERAAALLRTTITEARRMIWDLRPPVLDGLGLEGAFAALVQRTIGSAPASIDIRPDEIDEIGDGAVTALYMVAREALQNVRRHAGEGHLELSLRRCSEESHGQTAVCLRVVDDGCGFDSRAVNRKEHFGLTMMDEQMALVGGTLAVTSALGEGTVVEAVVPLRERSE